MGVTKSLFCYIQKNCKLVEDKGPFLGCVPKPSGSLIWQLSIVNNPDGTGHWNNSLLLA